MIERTESRVGLRRARRRRSLLMRATGVLVLAALGAGAAFFIVSREDDGSSERSGTGAHTTAQRLVLVPVVLSDDQSGQADSLTLFGLDAGGAAFGLFIPAGTQTAVPGQGDVSSIGSALAFGHATALELSVENLLGVTVDATVPLDDVSFGRIVDALGGIDVEVTERLFEVTDGAREQVFPLGRQHLDGAGAAVYLTYRAPEETEIDRFVRARHVWDGIATAARGKRAALAAAARALDATAVSPDDATVLAEMLAGIADARGPREYEVLPVSPISAGGGGEVYQLDRAKIDRLVARRFASSVSWKDGPPSARPRVEVRNGNGKPEIGERVAARIVPNGFAVVVSGNAPHFDFSSTRIVVYGDDEAMLALGRKVQELLGVGKIEIGTRGQTVVDITIVVGDDFPPRRG